MENLEIEYKVMVSKEDFELLLSKMGEDFHFYEQINYYYDTKKRKINRQGMSLRIRHFLNENKYLVTLKVKEDEGKREYEDYVEENDVKYLPESIVSILILNKINPKNIENIGKLKTIRKEFYQDGLVICFDHNYYYDIEDYEIECEGPSMEVARSILVSLLNKYNIKFEQSKDSKQKRALKRKELL